MMLTNVFLGRFPAIQSITFLLPLTLFGITRWRIINPKVRAETRQEAERVGKYIIRPLLSLERLSLDEREGRVCYRIINHLKLTFVAERPPPPHLVWQEFFLDSEAPADYFS